MKNILSYFGIRTIALSKGQKEWDNKLEERWHKEYSIYFKYRVTSNKEQYFEATAAWKNLMRYPGMFHDEARGKRLLLSFWENENPYPTYIPIKKQRKYI